jgi:hypothetical protein
VAGSGLAALRNQNAEPDIVVCIMAWLLSTDCVEELHRLVGLVDGPWWLA